MSSLIELNDFESSKLLTPVATSKPNTNYQHSTSTPQQEQIQNEAANYNSKLLKSKRHLSAAYGNKINFNYSPDLLKKTTQLVQQKQTPTTPTTPTPPTITNTGLGNANLPYFNFVNIFFIDNANSMHYIKKTSTNYC